MAKPILLLLCVLFSHSAFAKPYPITWNSNPFPGSRFYSPNDTEKHPSIILLHGSEGGSLPYLDPEANILATQGYAVLVLCYFDCGRGLVGQRKTLKEVNPQIILDAVAWLRSQSKSNGKVVVYGFSRGAELTMITGSLPTTPANRPSALIAHTPSDTFNVPYNWAWEDTACWLCKAGIGQCPEIHFPVKRAKLRGDYEWNPGCGPDDPNHFDDSQSAWILNGKNVPADTRIAIENYDGPILIIVGEKDEMWPVDQTRRIEATLKKAGRTPEVHYFPNGGHIFGKEDEMKRLEIVGEFLKRVP